MTSSKREAKLHAAEPTYPLRAVARLTGLSPELLRAWERRHEVVQPLRTPGGTRRYRAADLERLRLLKAAVDAGQRIGHVAHLELAELRRRSAITQTRSSGSRDEILSALGRLDAAESQQLLALQLCTLGPQRFAREVACPLLLELGQRWVDRQMGIAVEHLASGVLRSMLGAALQPTAISLLGPRIVFATPTGERHELGLLMAALTALGAGGNTLYLGVDIPVEDLLDAVQSSRAAALAVGLVALSNAQASRTIRALRTGLPAEVRVWIGGAGASDLALPDGVEHIGSLQDLEQQVALLGFRQPERRMRTR